jgi:putative addiction module antidote
MMQKAIKIGTSVGVVIPKHSLKKLGIQAGSKLSVTVDDVNKQIIVGRASATNSQQREDMEAAAVSLELIHQYRKALKRLSDA